MNFLRSHYEKIVFGVALLTLMVTAGWLLGKLRHVPGEPPPRRLTVTEATAIPVLDVTRYADAVDRQANPAAWTAAGDPFNLPVEPRAPEPEKVARPLPMLERVVHEPFTLLFKAYSFDDQTEEARNFQINLRDARKTFLVRAIGDAIRDRYADVGYQIIKFERKLQRVFDPNLQTLVDRDASELTVRRAGEEPMVLPLGRETVYPKPIAHLACNGPAQELRRDQHFECAGYTYRVTEIGTDQVIITDAQSGEQFTLRKP